MKDSQKHPRNWFVSLIGVVIAAFFLYIGVGVWLVEYNGPFSVFVRIVVSVLSFGIVYLAIKLIITGSWALLKKYLINMFEVSF